MKNTLHVFLQENWQRLELEGLGRPADLSYLMLTPRFKASSHLIFFVLDRKRAHPVLVAKVPRIPGDHGRLEREAANLRWLQGIRPEGFDSVPRVVAFEDFRGNRFLVETALTHETMRPALVRRRPQACTDAVLDWLLDVQLATHKAGDGTQVKRALKTTLATLERAFPGDGTEAQLLRETRRAVNPLLEERVPLVCEHGDLSAPNVLIGPSDAIGVVDWELAQPEGLPGVDLFFFLTYIAFARRRAQKLSEYLRAFHEAFWGEPAWTRSFVQRYCDALELPAPVLKPLFVLCWTRYVAGLIQRLQSAQPDQAELTHDTLHWLRTNRYYALWNHTLTHLEELSF